MRGRFLIFLIAVLLPFASYAREAARDSVEVDARGLADAIIARAEQFLGTPYVWAANGPRAFDCTGFTKYIYADFGYKLGRTVFAQSREGRPVTGGFENLQKGDILIFGRRDNKKRMGHAALYIGPDASGDNFSFIHAAKQGVIISEYRETYYRERFLGAVRILPDFVPEAPRDSIELSFEEELVIEVPDTLRLGSGDCRIVLMETGGWVYVGPDGAVSVPDGGDAMVLYPDGQWRSIPSSTRQIPILEKETEASSGNGTEPGTEVAKYHVVKSGDTLSGIAVRYHTSVKTICRLNGIKQTTILQIGKRLRVK